MICYRNNQVIFQSTSTNQVVLDNLKYDISKLLDDAEVSAIPTMKNKKALSNI